MPTLKRPNRPNRPPRPTQQETTPYTPVPPQSQPGPVTSPGLPGPGAPPGGTPYVGNPGPQPQQSAPDLNTMIQNFQSSFQGKNLMDQGVNKAANDYFGRILAQAGGDYQGLRNEIGPVRLGDRMRELLQRNDPNIQAQSGIINIGNGLTLNAMTGEVGPAQPSGPSATPAPAWNPQSYGSTQAGQFQFTPSQMALAQQMGATPEQLSQLAQLAQTDLTNAQSWYDKGASQGAGTSGGNPFWTREYNKALKAGKNEQQATKFANKRINEGSNGNIIDFYRNKFGTDDWFRENMAALGAGGGGQGFGGQGFRGPGAGGFPPQTQPGVPPYTGDTGPGSFPMQRPPGLDPNNFDPTQGAPPAQGIDFGNSPFSQLIESYLGGVISEGGQPLSPFAQQVRQGIGQQLGSLTQQPGGTGQTALTGIGNLISQGVNPNEDVINRNVESLREAMDRQRRSQTSQLEARLADRGLIGSGAQTEGLGRLERDIASQFATGIRDIGTDELSRARGTFEQALGLGEQGREFDIGSSNQLLGLAQNAASQDQSSLLSALGQGTGRQSFLTNTALDLLQQNQQAAQFAAQFGLQREQVLEQMQQGRIMQLIAAIAPYFQGAGIAQRGSV